MIGQKDFTLSLLAVDDLVRIHDHIAGTDPIAAGRLLNQINAKIAHMAAIGFPGAARDWLAPGLRALPYKNHCIYFRVTDSHLHVIRILHGRQELSAEDFPESDET